MLNKKPNIYNYFKAKLNLMPFTIERPVLFHSLTNPPTEGSSYDIEIKLLNPSAVLSLTKVSPGFQTCYDLHISDPSRIGLASSEQRLVKRAVTNLVLAFNLDLVRACMSKLPSKPVSADVTIKPDETTVSVEPAEEGKNIRVTETVFVSDSVHIRIKFTDEADEEQIFANLRKIIQLNRFDLKEDSPRELINLSKSLSEYESAMSTFDRLQIFKHLFNALQLSINWRQDRRGSALDSAIASISDNEQSEIRDWRRFYNRTKHMDRCPTHTSEYVQGLEKLHSFLRPLRETCKRVILNRLAQI